MTKNNSATKFQHELARSRRLRDELAQAIAQFDGDETNDREVFGAVVAPVAAKAGIDLSYDDTVAALLDGRDLSDDELDAVAGGTGTIYRMLISGTLAGTMVFASVPTAAFASAAHGGQATTQVAAASEEGDGIAPEAAASALSGYEADFDNEDIATPEGVEATDDGIILTSAAPRLVVMAAAQGSAPSPAGQNDWDRTGKAIDYTRDALSYVSKDAETVARYGKTVFDFVKAGCLGDYSAAFGGGVELLKLLGVLQREGDATNKEVISEIRELRELVEGMSARLDENTKQTYQNRLVVFDNAVGMLDIDCKTAETMLAKAARLADERGEGLVEEEAPTRPVVADPVYPEEPKLVLPEEPVLVLPDEPTEWSYDAQSDWQEECDDLSAQFQDDMEAWRVACAKAEQAYEVAHSDWEAECQRIRSEHDQAVAEAEAWDEDAAMAEWEARNNQHATDYTRALVRIAEEEEKAGNKDFKNFTKTMDGIETNFKLVAVECAKREGASPFHAFDSYWNLYFNFDTQGYYLRQAYRTSAEFQLKRSYSLLGVYYDMASYAGGEDDTDPRESLTTALASALNGIERLPAGNSPDTLRGAISGLAGFYYNQPVYSYTLGRRFNRSMFRSSLASIGIGDHYTEEQIKAYCSRLHGRTVAEDLRLAGVMIEYDPSWNSTLAKQGKSVRVSPQTYLGLGVNHEVKGSKWLTRYVPFDATGYQLREYNEDDGRFVVFLIND